MTKKKNKIAPLILQEQLYPFFKNLPNEDIGQLTMALMTYRYEERYPEHLPGKLLGMFEVIKAFADEDARKYYEICEKNRKNIKSRYENE